MSINMFILDSKLFMAAEAVLIDLRMASGAGVVAGGGVVAGVVADGVPPVGPGETVPLSSPQDDKMSARRETTTIELNHRLLFITPSLYELQISPNDTPCGDRRE
jgi:hypothetical protein